MKIILQFLRTHWYISVIDVFKNVLQRIDGISTLFYKIDNSGNDSRHLIRYFLFMLISITIVNILILN